jgi:hypothetical protein
MTVGQANIIRSNTGISKLSVRRRIEPLRLRGLVFIGSQINLFVHEGGTTTIKV